VLDPLALEDLGDVLCVPSRLDMRMRRAVWPTVWPNPRSNARVELARRT